MKEQTNQLISRLNLHFSFVQRHQVSLFLLSPFKFMATIHIEMLSISILKRRTIATCTKTQKKITKIEKKKEI